MWRKPLNALPYEIPLVGERPNFSRQMTEFGSVNDRRNVGKRPKSNSGRQKNEVGSGRLKSVKDRIGR